MTPPPSAAWCDRQKLAEWLAETIGPEIAGGYPELWLKFADALLASGCIEKKPTVEEVHDILCNLHSHPNPRSPSFNTIARAVLGVKEG